VASEGRAPVRTVLLLDVLDALGADPIDVRERVEILRAGGAQVTALGVGPGLDLGPKPGRGIHASAPGPGAVEAVRSLAAEFHPDLVLVASAARGGGALARALPASVPAFWWPTGTESTAASGWLGALARTLQGRALPEVFGGAPHAEGMMAELAGSQVEALWGRRPVLPLWDGDIVLAPEGLAGPGGALALSAFAAVSGEWSGMDLVTWSHPRESVEKLARGLGAGARVHQVGPPTRMAERAWCSQARAVLLTGAARLSGGLVLRALGSGCPILCVGPGAGLAPLAQALAARGCATVAAPEAGAVAAALSRILECGPEVKQGIQRGRDLAAAHDGAALGERLVTVLALPRPRSAAAA